MSYCLLLVGFLLLVKGADFFVEGSSKLAERLKVPSVIVGLTIVAMGTSAPEAAVSIAASISQNAGIAVGNIIGSNIFNLLAIVGLCAAIKPFKADTSIVKRDFPISILAAAVMCIMIWDGTIVLWEALVLLGLMLGYLALTIADALRARKVTLANTSTAAAAIAAAEVPSAANPQRISYAISMTVGAGCFAALVCSVALESSVALWEGLVLLGLVALYCVLRTATYLRARKQAEMPQLPIWLMLVYLAGGLAAVVLGGGIVVDSASAIATNLGMSQNLIGLTIVAVGTSLPELVTSLSALRKGDSGLALGNVVGSNIFNIFFILGMSGAIYPLTVQTESAIDALILIGVSALMYGAILLSRCKKTPNGVRAEAGVPRIVGILSVLAYIGYVVFIALR